VSETELIQETEAAAPPPAVRERGFEGGLLTPESVTEIEGQVVLIKRMRLAVCRLTEAAHWRDFAGKPYLLSGGIHAIASTIGVEFAEPKVFREAGQDERGRFVNFRCEIHAEWRGRRLYDLGTASTRDPFFGEAKGRAIHFEAINIGSVEKKSITNAQQRVLNKITGLGGVTWELLDTIGIHRGAGGTTRFKGQEGRMATGAGEWTPEKERLWGLLLELNAAAADQAAAELFRLTDNPQKGYAGIRDPAQLSTNQIKWLLPRVEALWKQQFGELPEAKDPVAAAAPREAGQEG